MTMTKKERKVPHFDVHWCIKSGNSICYQVCSVYFSFNLSLLLVMKSRSVEPAARQMMTHLFS